MILRRICQLMLTRITHQVSCAFDSNIFKIQKHVSDAFWKESNEQERGSKPAITYLRVKVVWNILFNYKLIGGIY